MYFANPWGLLGLLALPAILGIHLFRRRFPVLEIAGAHLWGIETRVADAGRKRDKLPWTSSLILELVAAFLLTLVLSDPRIDSGQEVVQLVAVLDDSASMMGHPVDGKPFRDLAIQELERRARRLGASARITLIKTGRHPTLLGSRGMRWGEAREALTQWKPSAPLHDFEPTWDEAVQLVGAESSFVFLTDRPTSEQTTKPQGMTEIAFGTPQDNVAISTAQWNRDRDSGVSSLYLRVSNIGRAATTATILGTTIPTRRNEPVQKVFEQPVSLDPMSERPFEVNLPAGLKRIEVTVTAPDDPLDIDNRVMLVESPQRVVRVSITLPAGSAEEKLTERVLKLLPDVRLVESTEADLIIGRAGAMPESRKGLWWLGIGPLNQAEANRKLATDVVGPYLIEKQNSLVDGVTLGGIVWGGVQDNLLPLVPVISYDRTVLLGKLDGTLTTAWVMNIDLAASNLGDSPDWPILLTNLVELRRESLPGLPRSNYRIEEIVRLHLPAIMKGGAATPAPRSIPVSPTTPGVDGTGTTVDASGVRVPAPPQTVPESTTVGAPDASLLPVDDTWKLIAPDGRSRPLVRDRRDIVELPPLDLPGIYTIVDGETTRGELAMNFFDPRESSLLDLRSDVKEPEVVYEPSKISLDNPFSWLIVLAVLMILAAILLDWHVLRTSKTAGRLSA